MGRKEQREREIYEIRRWVETSKNEKLSKEVRQKALKKLIKKREALLEEYKEYSIINIKEMKEYYQIQKEIEIDKTLCRELELEEEMVESEVRGSYIKSQSRYRRQTVKIYTILATIFLIMLWRSILAPPIEVPEEEGITFNEFMASVDKGEIESIQPYGAKQYKVKYKEKEVKEGETPEPVREEFIYRLEDPAFEREMLEKGVEIDYIEVGLVGTIFATMINLGLYVFIMWFVFKKVLGNGMGPLKQTELKSTNISHIETKLEDVAGMTEEKEEIMAALESMQEAEKYREMGIKPIKGILLEGPPGTGKTLIAKSIAGELGLPFLSFSGSEFVEMYVGLGASRVRMMFKEARKQAPCVLFIDEIDAFCGKRSTRGGTGVQESEQTMIELLNQMDGMVDNSGIFIMAATNRADNLDEAIKRPGRFDKVIHIGLPINKKDREEIVAVHLKDKKVEEGLELSQIGSMCYGLSGAEIASVMNDAALEAYRDGRDGVISERDIESAIMKLFSKGLAKGKHSKKDLRRVAIHEMGHAIMNETLGRKVIKVSVQPYSSGVGGVTVIDGEQAELQGLRTRQDLEDDIKVMYAGKVAEEVFLGECSVGAGNDLERATDTLATYVGLVGMGEYNMSYGRLMEMGMREIEGTMVREMQEIGARIYQEVVEVIREYKENPEKRAIFDGYIKALEENGSISSVEIKEDKVCIDKE